MRSRIILGTLLGTFVLIYALAPAQQRQIFPAPADGKQGILKATEAYVNAFNKGDLDGVLAAWSANAEYIDEAGKSIKGREALSAMFKTLLKEAKGGKMQVKTNSMRFIKEDVAIQDGSVQMTAANGDVDVSPFTAVWLRSGVIWQLDLVRDLSAQAGGNQEAAEQSRSPVKELAWLVGDWTHEDKEFKTNLSVHWMPGDAFLVLDYTIRRKDAPVMSLTQMVGWDPIAQQLHSWVFDSRGGFGEGHWSQRDKVWTVEVSGLTADGRQGSGTHRFTSVDANTFTFEAFDRSLDGQPIPDVKVTYQKNKASK